MSRVSEAELARIKAEVSVQRLVEGVGVELRSTGKDLVGRCPFHEDSSPSLVVTPSKNLWHCLGACGRGGGPIDWVMVAQGVSFRHAVELLREQSASLGSLAQSSPLATAPGPVGKSSARKLPALVAPDAQDRELLARVVGFYAETLQSHEEARAFLARRRIDDPEAVERFSLGFADRSLGYRLPHSQTVDGKRIRSRLQALGVLRASGHEHFRGSLVIPVHDSDGQVGEVYGRKVREDLRAGTPKHLYLPGPHRGVWNLGAFVESEEVIVAESLVDALTLWCAGFRHVTAAFGTGGWTVEHQSAVVEHGVKRVLVAFDADDAGDRGARSLAAELMGVGVECFRVELPRGTDVNEVAVSAKNPTDVLGRFLRKAAWMGAGTTPPRPVPVAAPVVSRPSLVEPTDTTIAGGAEARPVGEPSTRRAAGSSSAAVSSGEVEAAGGSAWSSGAVVLEPGLVSPVPRAALVESAVAVRPLPAPAPASPSPSSSVVSDPASEAPAVAPVAPVTAVAESASVEVPGGGSRVVGTELVVEAGSRRWRVRGLDKVSGFEALRVNVLVARTDLAAAGSLVGGATGFHVDTLDLYSARARAVFVQAAAQELSLEASVVKADLGRVLLACEARAEEVIKAAVEPEKQDVTLTAERRAAALDLLRDPGLVGRIEEGFVAVGMVGEVVNCLVGYLAAVSRLLPNPLAVIVQSTSAAGKSAVMESVLGFVPEEDRVSFSAMTGQSLFYLGESDLAHKVLSIAEEEGASRASYALKLLQSEGELSIASTGKDNASGRLVTHTYKVTGPTAIVLTTTAIDVDEELLNRCLVLTIDEDRDQTRKIHAAQRRAQTLEGLTARTAREGVVEVHRDAQRLLEPLAVVNPFAGRLTFADGRTRTRRDHGKYLGLIAAVTLLHQHQHQRDKKTVTVGGRTVSYVETTISDIRVAHRLAHAVLGQSLDELPPQTRRLLTAVDGFVTGEAARERVGRDLVRFTRRRLREHLAAAGAGWGDTQLKVHLARLVDLELLTVHRLESGAFGYELTWHPPAPAAEGGGDGGGGRFLVGLTDPDTLDTSTTAAVVMPDGSATIDGSATPDVTAATSVAGAPGSGYDTGRSGRSGSWSGSGRVVVGDRSAPGRGTETAPEQGVDPVDWPQGLEPPVTGGSSSRVVVEAAAGAGIGAVALVGGEG